MGLGERFAKWLDPNPKRYDNLQKNYDDLAKALDNAGMPEDFLKTMYAEAPATDVGLPNAMQLEGEIQVPLYPHVIVDLYNTVKQAPIYMTILNNLTNEIFKHGIVLKPLGDEDSLDSDEKKRAQDFLDSCGPNGESFIDLCQWFEMDLDIIDDAYILARKSYAVGDVNEILHSEVLSLHRVFPQQMRIVGDNQGKIGGVFKTCPTHREVVHTKAKIHGQGDDWSGPISDNIETVDEEVCPKCGKPMHDVTHVGLEHGAPAYFYIEGEVIHASKWFPSETYGYPPALTNWRYLLTLVMMERYMLEYYTKGHVPNGFAAISTRNQKSLTAMWRKLWNQREMNQYYPPVIGIDTETGRGDAKFVAFGNTMDEMQYIEVRNEIRERLSSFFGVSNVFMGDTSSAGGLNNESQQILVTDRALEKGRRIYKKYVFPAVTKLLNLENWYIDFGEGEITDLNAKVSLDIQRANHAQIMMGLGYEATLNDDGSFSFDKQEGMGMPGFEEGETDFFADLEEQYRNMENPSTAQPGEKMLDDNSYEMDTYQKAGIDFAKAKAVMENPNWKDMLNKLLKEDKYYYKQYAQLDRATVKKIMKILQEELTKPRINRNKIQKRLYEEARLPWNRSEVITRTEFNRASNQARELYYKTTADPEDKYYWSTTNDYRQTSCCSNIQSAVNKAGGSMTLDELKKTVKKESKSYMGPNWIYKDWAPHPNCRSFLSKKIDLT